METGSEILHTRTLKKDNAFDPSSGQRYQLSLVAENGTIQVAVLDVILNRYLFLAHFTFSGKPEETFAAFEKEFPELIQTDFKRVQVSLVESTYSLVPGALYNKEKARDYLSLLFSDINDQEISRDRVKNFDIQNIYQHRIFSTNYIRQRWKDAVIHHHITPLLDIIHLHFRNNEKPLIILHLVGNNLDIIGIDGRHLRFCNSFECHSPADVVYHSLIVLEQISPELSSFDIFAMGEIVSKEGLLSELKTQIPGIKKAAPPPSYKMAPELQELSPDLYYLLLNQYRVI